MSFLERFKKPQPTPEQIKQAQTAESIKQTAYNKTYEPARNKAIYIEAQRMAQEQARTDAQRYLHPQPKPTAASQIRGGLIAFKTGMDALREHNRTKGAFAPHGNYAQTAQRVPVRTRTRLVAIRVGNRTVYVQQRVRVQPRPQPQESAFGMGGGLLGSVGSSRSSMLDSIDRPAKRKKELWE